MNRVVQALAGSALAFASLVPGGVQASTALRAGATIEGHWEGRMERGGEPLAVRLDFHPAHGGWVGTFSCDSWWVLDYPLAGVADTANRITAELGEDSPTSFHLGLEGDTLVGAFGGHEGSGTVRLHRAHAARIPYVRRDARFRSGAVTLAGTLLVPRTAGRHAAVVFLHGSGPESRWGTSYYLADHLARRGIAALVFDQRGAGGSGGDWRQASFDDLASDAAAAVEWLRFQAGIDGRHVGLYGHSQGGTLCPLVAARSSHVAFVIAAAAVAGPIFEQDLYRVGNVLEDHGLAPDARVQAMAFYRLWLEAARDGRGAGGLDSAIAAARNQAWYSLVQPPARDSWLWQSYARIARFNSLDYWSHVRVPVLVTYGDRDRLEAVQQYAHDVESALRAARDEDVTVVMLPGAEHNLALRPDHELRPGETFEYYCPMDPAVVTSAPGICPLCNMYLEPRKQASTAAEPWWRGAPGWPDLVAAWVLARR